MYVYMYVYVYVSQSPSVGQWKSLAPSSQSGAEEREVKSQSRALQEEFGTEARVKIHS